MTAGLILTALTVAVLAGVFADSLPGLHLLPIIGAPRPPQIDFHIEGSDGLYYRMRGDNPEDVILAVGFAAGRRDELRRIAFNAYVVGSTEIVRCDQSGAPYGEGSRMMGPDGPYWQASGLTIPIGAVLLYFRVTIPRPGNYGVRFLLWSPEFYGRDDWDYRTGIRVLPPTPAE
jgi:hypothetical protein